MIRTDNGPLQDWCERNGIEHERIPCKTPNKNAHIESFHRILEEECLSVQEFGSYSEAYRAVAEFTEFYNKRRLHSSIHYMAPEEFHEAHERNLVKVTPIRV